MSTRPSTRLLVATLASAVVGAVLPLGAGAAQAEPGYVDRPAAQAAPTADHPAPWDRRDESVEAPAVDVVEDAAPGADEDSRLRVVTLQQTDGRPTVDVARVTGRDEAVDAVREAQQDPDVVAVSVDTRVRAVGAVAATLDEGPDPRRAEQWALDRLVAETAWGHATGQGAVVAVVDSGVDGSHPDLTGQLTAAGYDFVTNGGDGRLDENSHGTHVAGVIAAAHGNSIGITGLAPRARIMPVRVLDANGSGWSSAIAKGILYAVDHGADVVNLSLGGRYPDSATASAVSYAVSQGVAVVAAAGNERQDGSPTTFPAAYTGVIAVASVDKGDGSSFFSNTGSYVDVAAPGDRILSTVAGGYATLSGTSMAAPFVSATAALAVDATDGAVDVSRLEQALTGTAEDLGAAGWDPYFGHGLISPYDAVCVLTTCDGAPAPEEPAPTTTSPAPAPAPEADPVTEPAPEPTPEPAPGPAPVTQPAPGTDVAPVRNRIDLVLVGRGGTAVAGQRRSVRFRVVDAGGTPVGGQRVLVVARRSGEVVVRRQVVTGEEGRGRAFFRIRGTMRFVLRAPATTTTYAARSERTLRWRGVPDRR